MKIILDRYTSAGFKHYGTMTTCNDLARGVRVTQFDKAEYPAVYIITDAKTNEVLKIGETQDISKRCRAYQSILNATNNRIREYVHHEGDVNIYALELMVIRMDVLGFECSANVGKSLESHLLFEWMDKCQTLPKLNATRR